MEEFVALWDTGATAMVISPKIVAALGLMPSGVARVHYADGTAKDVPRFVVNIRLPNNWTFQGWPATLGNPAGTDVLIGMDIISRGDFAVTNGNGRTTFSFRMPAQADIDFVAEGNSTLPPTA